MTTRRKFTKVEKYHDEVLDQLLDDITPEEQERTDHKMMLAAKIDKAIEARGWNGARFAAEMGKKPSEVSKWLSGKHNFTVETLWAIEKKLGISLINLEEEKTDDGFKTLGVYHTAQNALPSPAEHHLYEQLRNKGVWFARNQAGGLITARKVFVSHASKEQPKGFKHAKS